MCAEMTAHGLYTPKKGSVSQFFFVRISPNLLWIVKIVVPEWHLNLTDKQKELLRELIRQHRAGRNTARVVRHTSVNAALIYPYGVTVRISADFNDFHQLHRENLITLIPQDSNVLSVSLTGSG